jgi:hypothetical protein
MDKHLNVNDVLPGKQSEVLNKSGLVKTHNPKYYRFLAGASQGINGLAFTPTGWENIAKRFGLSVEDAQQFADEFIANGDASE